MYNSPDLSWLIPIIVAGCLSILGVTVWLIYWIVKLLYLGIKSNFVFLGL